MKLQTHLFSQNLRTLSGNITVTDQSWIYWSINWLVDWKKMKGSVGELFLCSKETDSTEYQKSLNANML